MPLKLCDCNRHKFDKVIDQVKILSKTIDELQEEIGSLKTSFADQSSDDGSSEDRENFEKTRDNGPLRKLTQCFRRNVFPFISRDTACNLKKKCSQFCRYSAQTSPCSAQFCSQEPSFRQCRCTSPSSNKRKYNYGPCQRPEPRVKSSTRKTSKVRKKCAKTVRKRPEKLTLSTSSSDDSSRCSPRVPRPKKCRCSHQLPEILKSRKPSDDETKKEKTTPNQNCRRSVDENAEKKKCVAAVTEDSTTSSGLLTSKTSLDYHPTNCQRSKKFKGIKVLRSATNDRKSALPQCCPDCLHIKASNMCPMQISTNEIIANLVMNEICKSNLQKKRLETQETQTFIKKSSITDDLRCDACEENAGKWLRCGSLFSLISHSPTTINCSLKTNEFTEKSSPNVCHNQENITFETKRVMAAENGNGFQETNFVQANCNEKKPAVTSNELLSDERLANNRPKRTYVILPKTLSIKIDGKVDQLFNEQREDLPPETTCLKLEIDDLARSYCRRLSKEEYPRRKSEKYFLKFSSWLRKKLKSSSNEAISSANCKCRSPSAPELSVGSCSLTSNCNFGTSRLFQRQTVNRPNWREDQTEP